MVHKVIGSGCTLQEFLQAIRRFAFCFRIQQLVKVEVVDMSKI